MFVIFNMSGMLIFFANQDALNPMINSLVSESVTDNSDSEGWDDRIIQECDKEMAFSEKVFCVNRHINANFDYVNHDDYNIQSPEYTYANGGICRDYVALYRFLFNKMGIKTQQIVIPSHTFLIAHTEEDGEYCLVDQKIAKCFA
jgi:transglutaminase-like putative cysteine protease